MTGHGTTVKHFHDGREPFASVPDSYAATYDGFEQEWISTSSLSLMMMCGIAFKLRYIDRIPEPINIRQSAGLGVHKGRQTNLAHWIHTEQYLKSSEVKDATRDDVNERFETNEYAATEEFADKSKQAARGIAVDLAVELTAVDYSEFQVNLQPAAVELPLSVQFPGVKRLIVGKIDNVLTDASVVDLKTGKRAYGEDRAQKSMQLTTYGLLVHAKFGKLPPDYRIESLARGAKNVTTNVYHASRSVEDLERQIARFNRACDVIDSGVFLPCNPEHWKCSREYCGYFDMCEFGRGN